MKKFLKKLYIFFINKINPKTDISNYQINHYGTNYGGYDIVDSLDIKNVISCGLGEDASFDVEIINKKNCIVYTVDPTPRAIKHYDQIKKKFGSKKNASYSIDGNQPINTYDLENINEKNFILINRAMYDSSKSKIKLYQPLNDNYVSASIDQKKNYSQNFFYAEVITLDKIISEYQLEGIDLLKLDIEGSEIEVIYDFLKKNIYPKQLTVEFTHTRSLNLFDHLRIFFADRKLKKNNYTLVFKNKKGDFTYIHEK